MDMPIIEGARRRVLKWRETRLAYLGDGQGRIYVPGSNGTRAYVRFAAGANSNGYATMSSPVSANVLPVALPEYDGAQVRVGYDDYGELCIMRADVKGLAAAGISPRAANPLNPQTRMVYPDQVVVGQVRPVGTASNPSSKVTWQTLIYDDHDGNLKMLHGPSGPSSLLDLAPYVPASSQHRVVVIWLDTYTNGLVVTQSVAQSMTVPIDFTDYQEADDERPPDSIPLGTFVLRDANVNIDSKNIGPDIRQIISRAQRNGNPQVVRKHERIWPDKQAIYYDALTIVTGSMEVIGELCVI